MITTQTATCYIGIYHRRCDACDRGRFNEGGSSEAFKSRAVAPAASAFEFYQDGRWRQTKFRISRFRASRRTNQTF